MTMKLKTITAAIALTLLATPAFAQEASPSPVFMGQTAGPTQPVPVPENQTPQQRLEFLLSGYHYFPSKADLDAIAKDDEMAKMLRILAEDNKARVMVRSRAVDALAYYSDEATVGFLTHVMKRDPKDADPKDARLVKSMKHHAIMSIAKSLEDKSIAPLEYALTHDDHQIRMTAISAIGKHAGEAGKVRLGKLAETEKNIYVQKELRKYVKL